MKDFKKIITVLKIYIATKKETKVLDKDVALLLCMTQARFATIKKRNVTPFEDILLLCERESLSCNEIFFD
jgi:hypothetical protein